MKRHLKALARICAGFAIAGSFYGALFLSVWLSEAHPFGALSFFLAVAVGGAYLLVLEPKSVRIDN